MILRFFARVFGGPRRALRSPVGGTRRDFGVPIGLGRLPRAQPAPVPAARRGVAERGMALVWALFACLVIAGIVAAGSQSIVAVDKLGQVEFHADGHARAVAEAGLVDAFAWFRRQQTQPVVTFAPKLDLAATPVVNETDDASIGLVRDFEIMPSVWGRYEVRKPVAAETWTDSNANGLYDNGEAFTDTNGNGRHDAERETRDVSTARGLAGAGSVWRIESHGTVFRRPNAALPLGTAPNTRLSSITIAAEVRRMVIVAPAAAAVCVKTRGGITIGNRTRIAGGTKGGIVGLTGTGTPVITGTPEITGTPANGTVPSYDDTINTVFGVSLAELKGMADGSYATASAFPAPIGDYTLNVVTGPITFDAARQLRGTGVVVVIGNCTVTDGSNSFFNGVLFVQGNLTIRAPVYFRGTVIATGTCDIAGSGGDYSEIDYDAGIISQTLLMLGQYRYSTGAYIPSNRLPDGMPDENDLIRLQKSGLTLPGGNLPVLLGKSLP